ncbi:PREDICTED: uncharacterized protein LOC108361731 [Rhagoletis zephyria]|uniref:uncharacterized protein LOC108361731 n=1 Tax=Rhagoletis zephyria TaxID=28612 RepID=UPI0008114FDD|nr:PREDICTED: uncharacterized protein LOC108361731 [Rhagoletis zephyria]
MAPWSWRNPCTSGATDSDESPQTTSPVRKRSQSGFAGNAHQRENGTESTNGTSTYQKPYSNPKTKHTTPVLFSTNSGLHLRVTKPKFKPCAPTGVCMCGGTVGPRCNALNITGCSCAIESGIDTRLPASCIYEIHFCDLERWSTNRANTICLEDTFIVSRRNNSLPSSNMSSADRDNTIFKSRNQRSGSIFCVPSGSRHALVMPHRSLYQRSTSIQSTFERFGVQ